MKPEIMSPAGHWPQLRAAIEAGADSVYFGLTHFSARAKVGFELAELPDVMRTLHERGVKGYVTVNTVVFEREVDQAARAIAEIANAGADAVIVQDWAVARLAREIAPHMAVHGSTQMSITDAAGVAAAQALGVSRVVLARELSMEEIAAIRRATAVELEIFVHGALCVSYSGQCFSSEAWGGRSANRGQCAQTCRLSYDMVVDGRTEPLGDARYLLSPGDLYTLRQIPEIVRLGVHSLKIEGRYKDAEYVALTTSAYRRAVDGAAMDLDAEEARLEQIYSRGLGPWFLTGTDHQAVVRGRAPRHRGRLMGRVEQVWSDGVQVALEGAPLKPGDGVVFDAADWRSPDEAEEGGRVYQAETVRGGQELRFANGAIRFDRIQPGDLVWRTQDADVERAARPFLDPAAPVTRQPVNVRVDARVGSPLRVEWSLRESSVVTGSDTPLQEAGQHALSEAMLAEQLGRLGGTAYRLGTLDARIEGRPFAPASLLNRLRREAVEKLASHQRDRPTRAEDPESVLARHRAEVRPAGPAALARIHVLVRTPEQLDAAIAARPASITLDYLDLYGLRGSVDRVRAAGLAVRVASPRVLKPGEEKITDFLRRLETPLLVRSLGLLRELTGAAELTADFSLNVTNALSAAAVLAYAPVRITPGHDLNGDQVTELARAVGGSRLEVVAYQHLPVFHTEHCVFCRFLSTGTSYLDCGRPCEQHRVALRDHSGREHPVLADVGCRNTVFGAEAQQASQYIDSWREAGIGDLRLEFAHESPREVTAVCDPFAGYLSGRLTSGELWTRLRRAAPQGITEGSLFVPAGSEALVVLR